MSESIYEVGSKSGTAPRLRRTIGCWQAIAAVYVVACAVMDLFPQFGPPHFRYTGVELSVYVWNFGWPLTIAIYDARFGLFFGPGLVMVPPQLFILMIAAFLVILWKRHCTTASQRSFEPILSRHRIGKSYSGISQDDKLKYEEAIFVDCIFTECRPEGSQIDALFVNCQFIRIDWYWCVGTDLIFIDCEFIDCDLRASFYYASFVRCKFDHCQTGNDNLGKATKWENCLATDCVLNDTILPIVRTKGPS